MNSDSLDDQLDALVARYSDELEAGTARPRDAYLAEVPAEIRPGLERCLKMIEAGTAKTPSGTRPLCAGLAFDQYELIREIGRGGMALVWLARDQKLQRPVALKILRPGLALEARHTDRFRREATAMARLRHPNVVQVHGTGEAHGYHYFAMEFVEGPSLATVLEALPPGPERTAADLARACGSPELGMHDDSYERALARLLVPAMEALEAAHREGLVHRDIKPSNILLRGDGRAVLADFGLAKGESDPALSLTGDALGTPYYMSPEQAYVTGQRVDHRTDIYSLGVTLYEALGGTRPFGGDSFLEVIESIKTTTPPPVRSVNPGCSRSATAVVRKAMARSPEDRYESADQLHKDLVALSEGRDSEAAREQGGLLRRFWIQCRYMTAGLPYEYRSGITFLGLPLVHAFAGPHVRGRKMRVAKGWLAIGDIAFGVVSCGLYCFGLFTFGLVGVGIVSASACGIGLLAFGGVAVGPIACGGLSMGGLAIGLIAIGRFVLGALTFGGSPPWLEEG